MFEYTFPISGPLRFATMLIECMLAFICFELGMVFVVKYRRKQASKAYKQELGYASMFLGFSIMWFCFIAADYFMNSTVTTPFMIWPSGSPRALVVSTSFLATITGAFIFIILIERHQKILVARFFFTILYSGLIVIFALLYMIDLDNTGFMDAILVLVFMVFLVAFIADLSKRMKTRRAVKITFFGFFSSFIVLGCGYIFTVDIMLDITGIEGRLIGSIIQLGAFISISIQFLRLPSFATLDWHKQIDQVYIIDKAGVCLVQKSFTTQRDTRNATGIMNVNENLVSSALSSVNYLLQEMTAAASQGLSTIKKGDKTITMYSSELVNGVVISMDENYLISYTLKNFVQTFESIYRGVLATWKGDTKVFQPVEAMAERIFSSS